MVGALTMPPSRAHARAGAPKVALLRRAAGWAGRRAWPLSAPMAAHACTVCDSKTGHAVRAGIFDGHFLPHLLLTLSPFPVLAAAVILCHRCMPYLLPGSDAGHAGPLGNPAEGL